MMSAINTEADALISDLRKHLGLPSDEGTEIIQGRDVEEVAADCVDLSIAYSPVLQCRGSQIPVKVESTLGGKVYRLMLAACPWQPGPIFRNVKPVELKVMRARYLLQKGEHYDRLCAGEMPDPEERDRVIRDFFDGSVWLMPGCKGRELYIRDAE